MRSKDDFLVKHVNVDQCSDLFEKYLFERAANGCISNN